MKNIIFIIVWIKKKSYDSHLVSFFTYSNIFWWQTIVDRPKIKTVTIGQKSKPIVFFHTYSLASLTCAPLRIDPHWNKLLAICLSIFHLLPRLQEILNRQNPMIDFFLIRHPNWYSVGVGNNFCHQFKQFLNFAYLNVCDDKKNLSMGKIVKNDQKHCFLYF